MPGSVIERCRNEHRPAGRRDPEYVEKKPKDFRLLFMIDEVGQYVGTDTDMLINLQSLVEEIGRTCGAKVWVMCTGQEALDEIIKVRQSEFSRIQARFKVHLSLTSSSADEVIQKRLLKKTSIATQLLEGIYTQSRFHSEEHVHFQIRHAGYQGIFRPTGIRHKFPVCSVPVLADPEDFF